MDKVTICPWEIRAISSLPEWEDYYESIFSQGNGYMGVRGYSPVSKPKDASHRSTYLSGFFEYIRPGITDMVNQPDFSSSKLLLNGYDVEELAKENDRRTLHMQDGTLNWQYTVTDPKGRKTEVRITRFLSMADTQTAAIRFIITPKNYDGKILLETGVDAGIMNLPISDNQLSDNIEFVKFWEDFKPYSKGNAGGICVTTKVSKRETAMEYRIALTGISNEAIAESVKEEYAGTVIDAFIEEGKDYIIDKFIAVSSYRECNNPKTIAAKKADKCLLDGFHEMFLQNQKSWSGIWDMADIKLETEEELQGAVRYNIFQLIQSDPATDPKASIGARGLTHGRYKGCYFWDTEIFMLPFFLHTNPEAAKNLLLYRYHTLQDAVNGAKAFSLKGARYSWMASDTGSEQCETWDTGCCEIHITADIAYAMGRYVEITGDEAFLKDYAAEVYIQTARYWASRFTYDSVSDCYHLLFVKGPDEYCGVTTNNLFTVKMAAHNLTLALEAIAHMESKFHNEWDLLKEKLDYKEEESSQWKEIILKAVMNYEEENHLWIQDDTFKKLEPLNIEEHKEDDIPLYHKISFDRLQRYQVLKQPDVLMLMALLKDEFSIEERQAAWDYYEPKTLHDSTLSFGIHGLLSANLGLLEKADTYLYKSIYLDLKDIMKNTGREGIHTAALGASWQALVFGLGGIWANSKGITCNPSLPEHIHKMEFKISYLGTTYKIVIEQDKEPKILSTI